jgi:hypothetical protein
MTDSRRILQSFVGGCVGYQRLLLDAIRPLTVEQLSRTAPFQWTAWQLARHMAGSRASWFHDVLGEGDEVVARALSSIGALSGQPSRSDRRRVGGTARSLTVYGEHEHGPLLLDPSCS